MKMSNKKLGKWNLEYSVCKFETTLMGLQHPKAQNLVNTSALNCAQNTKYGAKRNQYKAEF